MLPKFSIALFLYSKNRGYGKLIAFAQSIHDGLTASSYTGMFPTLATLAGAISSVQNYYTLWSSTGTRSKSDLVNLQNAADSLRTILTQLSQWVMDQSPNDPVAWTDVNFPVKSVRTPAVPFEKVQNLRQNLRAVNLPNGGIEIRWNRPLNSGKKKVGAYRVLRGTVADFFQAEEIGTVTRNKFVDVPPAGQVSFYFIVPVNSAGDGAYSDGLKISVGPQN